jgi:hypothetical protein
LGSSDSFQRYAVERTFALLRDHHDPICHEGA